MKTDNRLARRAAAVWPTVDGCSLDDLRAVVERDADPADTPFAAEVVRNVPVYDAAAVRAAAADPAGRRAVMAEWVEVMTSGPGVIVLRGAYPDGAVVDAVTAHFRAIIAEERASGTGGGDHFARPGANDRVWNALEKLCLRDPEAFAAYYANDLVAMVSEAWLGPGYQMTSQVNSVNPGGAAQSPHRDYHLGFMSPGEIARYPAHVHALSPVLTLQGAVAHCDMPVESGPTLYLPFSQAYPLGYLATALPDVRAYFEARHVQLPLAKGDAAFFNPALFHAAGTNRTADVVRIANLLQVSSAFGRAMESVDRTRMARTLYPALLAMTAAGRLDGAGAEAAVAAAAEGYPFPTNLDSDPPVGGLAPESQQALMRRALAERWTAETFSAALDAQAAKRLP